MSWNVEGLSLAERSPSDFTELICKYDIICLSETWSSSHTDLTLKGYDKVFHSFRTYQHKRAKRPSGGIIIYIKNCIAKGVDIVKMQLIVSYGLSLTNIFSILKMIFTYAQQHT